MRVKTGRENECQEVAPFLTFVTSCSISRSCLQEKFIFLFFFFLKIYVMKALFQAFLFNCSMAFLHPGCAIIFHFPVTVLQVAFCFALWTDPSFSLSFSLSSLQVMPLKSVSCCIFYSVSCCHRNLNMGSQICPIWFILNFPFILRQFKTYCLYLICCLCVVLHLV